jgi:hypothetical protein
MTCRVQLGRRALLVHAASARHAVTVSVDQHGLHASLDDFDLARHPDLVADALVLLARLRRALEEQS